MTRPAMSRQSPDPSAARRKPGRALALASVPAFMIGLDALVVTIALATIRRDLHATVAQLGWTVNSYVLTFGVLILPAAVLGDRLGRRRMFAAGLAIFTAASAACALAPSPGLLIAARAVQGAGVALLGGFAVRQLQTQAPMVPRYLFTRRTFLSANAATFLLAASLFAAAFLLPQYLQAALGYSALKTGVLLLPWTAITMLLTPAAGALADRIGNR
jgi:MFS family permease